MLQGQKPFSLYSRKRKNGKPVYYAKLRMPDGSWSSGKNTGQTSKNSAEAWAIKYLQTGQVVHKENVSLAAFAKDFFSWEGDWATDKRVTGKRISLRQCKEKTALLDNRILPVLGKIKLTNIDKAIIREFRNNLFKQGLSGPGMKVCKILMRPQKQDGAALLSFPGNCRVNLKG